MRACRTLRVNMSKQIIDLQLAQTVQGGLEINEFLINAHVGVDPSNPAVIDQRVIDTEMKFTAANTPSIFPSVSICYSIRCCLLISILDSTTCPIRTAHFRDVASLFVINKRMAIRNYRL